MIHSLAPMWVEMCSACRTNSGEAVDGAVSTMSRAGCVLGQVKQLSVLRLGSHSPGIIPWPEQERSKAVLSFQHSPAKQLVLLLVFVFFLREVRLSSLEMFLILHWYKSVNIIIQRKTGLPYITCGQIHVFQG